MKRYFVLIFVIIVIIAFLLSQTGQEKCHYCGGVVGDDPVEANGRTYCSYNCYMSEVFGLQAPITTADATDY